MRQLGALETESVLEQVNEFATGNDSVLYPFSTRRGRGLLRQVRDRGESVAAALRFDGQRDDYASVRLCRPPPNIDAEAKSIFCKEMAMYVPHDPVRTPVAPLLEWNGLIFFTLPSDAEMSASRETATTTCTSKQRRVWTTPTRCGF